MNRICGICSDKALGYNFNALTCESCKAFFRRNALRNKNFHCLTGGNCQITINNRKYCRYCRLKKCFEIGMRKDWILSNNNNNSERKNFNSNSTNNNDELNNNSINNNNIYIIPIIIDDDNKKINSKYELINKLNEKISKNLLLKNNNKIINDNNNGQQMNDFNTKYYNLIDDEIIDHKKNDKSIINNNVDNGCQLDCQLLNDDHHQRHQRHHHETLKNQSINDNWNNIIPDIIYNHAIQLEHTFNPLNQDFDYTDQELFQLNELEQIKLNEVNYYLRTLYDFGDNPENQIIIKHKEDSFKYLEMSMKNLIITVKNLPTFKQMCQEDQIQLLKGGAIEIKWIINLKFFDETSRCCLLPNPNKEQPRSFIRFDNDYLMQTYGKEIITRLSNLFFSFHYDWRKDNSILNLLSMMILFFPGKQNLIHRDYIELQFQIYSHLLRKYLQCKYSSICEGRSCYLKLLSGVQEIRNLNEQLMLKFDMKFAGPLTLELYDLNQHNINVSN